MKRSNKSTNQQNRAQRTERKTSNRQNRQRDDHDTPGNEGADDQFIFGKHAVETALGQDKDYNKLYVQSGLDNSDTHHILRLAKSRNIPVQVAPKVKLNELSNHGVHQGFVLTQAAFDYASVADIFANAEKKQEQPFIIILDGIEDPYNFGSIIRSADAAGAHGIIIPKHRSVTLTGTVAKVSTGAIEKVPVARVTNLTREIGELKEKGVWIFGTDVTGTSYTNWQPDVPLALIIGNEGKGISPLVKKQVDEMLTIPMYGDGQSLNASVAAGLMLFEVARKRH